MREVRLAHFKTQQAKEKLGRRVRAIADIPAYEIKQGATGTVTRALHYYDRTADLLVTWDDSTITVLSHRRQLQGFFDRDYYERFLEEIDARRN